MDKVTMSQERSIMCKIKKLLHGVKITLLVMGLIFSVGLCLKLETIIKTILF